MLIVLFTLSLWDQGHQGKIVFSSNDYPAIFYSIWSFWHNHQGNWTFAVSGDQQTGQGISVFQWNQGQAPQLLVKTDAREGIYSVRNTALSPSGNRLVMRGFGNPMVFELDLKKPIGFRRSFVPQLADCLIFWDENRVLAGSKYPEIKFAVHGPEGSRISQIEGLVDRLPDDIDHPVEPYYYKNAMHLSKHGPNLAIGFGLFDQVTIWDGKRRTLYNVGFPGYEQGPKKFPKHPERLRAWFQKFHHLFQLTWFKGKLYGMFRKGYGDLGVWVEFRGGGSPVVWDNNRNEVRIFAIQGDELILGRNEVDSNQEVTWHLWQASSFPSP